MWGQGECGCRVSVQELDQRQLQKPPPSFVCVCMRDFVYGVGLVCLDVCVCMCVSVGGGLPGVSMRA